MPYAPSFVRALRGLSHGMKARSKSLRKITPGKAQAMLEESGDVASYSKAQGALRRRTRKRGLP